MGNEKKKIEHDLHIAGGECEEIISEARENERTIKKMINDALIAAETLKKEQDHGHHIERKLKNTECQVRELELKLDQSEHFAQAAAKKAAMKFETRTRELADDLKVEQRKSGESVRYTKKIERRMKEQQQQIEDMEKNLKGLQDFTDNLQGKVKSYKKMAEDAEEETTSTLNKLRKVT